MLICDRWQVSAPSQGRLLDIQRGHMLDGALKAKARLQTVWFGGGLCAAFRLDLNVFQQFCLTPHRFLFILTQLEMLTSGPVGN